MKHLPGSNEMSMRFLSVACLLLLTAVCPADSVLDAFYAENAGKTLRRLPTVILPENAFFMIHGPSLAKGAENANAALMELLAEKGTYNFITLTLRCHPELGDAEIVAEAKKVIEVAHRHGIQVGMDIDPRIARREFLRRWPDEMQCVVVAAKGETYASGRAQATLVAKGHGDHMCAGSPMGYDPVAASPLVAYAVRFSGGAIVPGSMRKVPVRTVANSTFKLVVEAEGLAAGETLVAFGEFRLFSCDVYSEHLLPFTRELMERYKGYGADGAMRDEWGFPSPSEDGFHDGRAFWYSPGYAAAYAKRTGRSLVDDFIVMAYPSAGDDSLRRRLAGEYMYLNFLRNAEIEEDMYATSKRLWGTDCYVTKHPTWYAQLEYHNIWHDGIDWWRAKRDWAQSDETVPRCALLGMMRKFGGPNWMNEWYAGSPESYPVNLWKYAVAGARMVVHPLFGPNPWKMFPDDPVRANRYYHEPILTPEFVRAQGRIRLLNLMTRGQVASQSAVVFGHKRAINFTDEKTWLPGESDLGIKNWRTIDWGGGLAADFWKAGYFADLFPSDEFSYGTFTVDEDGYLRVGTQAYPAVVLTHLDAEDVAAFRRLTDGKTLKTKVFAWDASGLPGATALAKNEATEAIAYLDAAGAIRQPVAVGKRESWSKAWQGDILPLGDGTTTLTDGTVQRVKGAVNDLAGDDIAGTLDLGNAKVEYVAKGVFAARADKDGRLAGLAAGGATRIKGLGIDLTLKTPEDFALYRLSDGKMAGVWQTADGAAEIPAGLKPLAESWTKLILPKGAMD